MDDVILRSTSWEEDAIAHLRKLLLAEQRRQEALRADLAAMVGRLDWSPGTDESYPDPPPPGRMPPPVRPGGSTQRAEENYSLPRRTTHGGGFGPQVRAKLIAEARSRGL